MSIPAVATPAHARGQVIGLAEALDVVTAVLTALTRCITSMLRSRARKTVATLKLQGRIFWRGGVSPHSGLDE